ncbi:MAG: CHAP domain-containing protein [bacterium]
MSIIPWLNSPGRPIKKKFYKMPYSPPYKGSPYEYIDLPNPGDLPKAVWENIMKDFDQTLRFRYTTVTSPRLETATDEFMEQPGSVGISITADPRKYLKKGLGGVAMDTLRNWVESVISWGDLDTIIEEKHIWQPLTRGKNGSKTLSALVDDTQAGKPVGVDRSVYAAYHQAKSPLYDPKSRTPYEGLALNIEEWIRNGKSKRGRAFPWSKTRGSWLNAVYWDTIASAGGRGNITSASSPRTIIFLADMERAKEMTTWIGGSGNPRGYAAVSASPIYIAVDGATDWKDALSVIQATPDFGYDSKYDKEIFEFQLKKALAKELNMSFSEFSNGLQGSPTVIIDEFKKKKKVEKIARILGDGVSEVDVNSLTPANLDILLSKGYHNKARGFYSSRAIALPTGGQQLTLQELIFDPSTPENVKKAALTKHVQIKAWVDKTNAVYNKSLEELYTRVARDPDLRKELDDIIGDPSRLDNLLNWQALLTFRENVFKTQDFLDAAFDDNSLFRSYVWLGKLAQDMPDWMGDWGSRLTYLTPQFYIEGAKNYIDENILGVTAITEKKLLFNFFGKIANAAYIPFLGKQEKLQYARAYKAVWPVLKKLDNLSEEGAIVNTVLIDADVKKALLQNKGVPGLKLSDLIKDNNPVLAGAANLEKHILKKDEYDDYVAFIDGYYQGLKTAKLVDSDKIEEFFALVKDKFVDPKKWNAGFLVRIGRFLDHRQNVFVDKLFKVPVLGKGLESYSKFFKTGVVKAAESWAGNIGKGVSAKLIGLAGKPGLKAFSGLLKIAGSFFGAAGAIIAGVVTWIGGKLVSDIWGLLRGRPMGATKEAVTKLGKWILGAVACCVSPILLLIFIILFIIAGVFNQVSKVGQFFTIGKVFDRLEVVKEATFNPVGRKIEYRISIRNKSGDTQKVEIDSDRIDVVPADCSIGKTEITTGTSAYGRIVYPSPSFVNVEVDIAAGDTYTVTYTVEDISSSLTDVTYLNTARIAIKSSMLLLPSDTGEVFKKLDIGRGGCVNNLGLDAVASLLANCLRKNSIPDPTWGIAYRVFDTACVRATGLLDQPQCQVAFDTYYLSNATYYPDNVQCTAFANIALGCYKGSSYNVGGNASAWLSNIILRVFTFERYDLVNISSTGATPELGSVIVFRGGVNGYGHVGIVTNVSVVGERAIVVMVNANMRDKAYSLFFDARGNLINPESLPGLTYAGFFNVK